MKEVPAKTRRRPRPQKPGPGRGPRSAPAPHGAADQLGHRQGALDGTENLRARLAGLRRLRFELEVSRDRYAHLYDFAPVGSLTPTPTGRSAEATLTARP